jgi:hypothetical protein
MSHSALILILPFVLTLVIAGALRFALGPERGPRLAGVAVMISFAVSWSLLVKPGWAPVDDLRRIGHIALGAGISGLLIDFFTLRRLWAAVVSAIVIVVGAWSSVTGALLLPTMADTSALAMTAILALAAFLFIARLDVLRTQGMTAVLLIGVAAFGLSAVAHVADTPQLASTGLILGLVMLAYAVLQAVIDLVVADVIILGAGSTLLAITMALARAEPEARFALLLVPLIFFAEGTARRVPLPQARISVILYPLVLVGLAALPLALAVLVTYVTARA